MIDLLITHGLVLDGSGSDGYTGSIGVEDNTIHVLRGDVSSVEAARVIDASGRVVCPGFIDMHAHSGLVLLAHPEHEPKVRQGVTTEVIGVDGNSYAPFRAQADLRDFIRMNSGLDGDPELSVGWSTVEEYLLAFDGKAAVNIAYVVGNSPLRINAVGWDDRPATAAEVADMKAMLREAMEEGAFGISTGLDYPPGSYADTAELVELSGQAASLGGHLPHPRPLPARRSLPRPVPGSPGDREPERGPGPCDPLLPAGPGGGRRRDHAGAAGRRPPRRRRRDLRQLSVHAQQHAPVDRLAAVGPGGRPQPLDGGASLA